MRRVGATTGPSNGPATRTRRPLAPRSPTPKLVGLSCPRNTLTRAGQVGAPAELLTQLDDSQDVDDIHQGVRGADERRGALGAVAVCRWHDQQDKAADGLSDQALVPPVMTLPARI